DDNLILFNDNGIPATVNLEKRKRLQELISVIEHDEVQEVLVTSEQSLFRNGQLVDVAHFMHVCREHTVLVVTLQCVYDFSNIALANLFRMAVEHDGTTRYVIYARTNIGRRYSQKQRVARTQ